MFLERLGAKDVSIDIIPSAGWQMIKRNNNNNISNWSLLELIKEFLLFFFWKSVISITACINSSSLKLQIQMSKVICDYFIE